MPAAHVSVDDPSGDIALTVSMTELVVGGAHTDIVYVNADADIYVCISRVLETGGTVLTRRYRVPAGVCHPIRVTGQRIALAARAGTTTAWAIAMADMPYPKGTGLIDPCA